MDAYGQLHLEQQLCLALQTTSSLVTRLYRRQLEPLGLTHPQYLVLIALWEAVDPVTMGQLGGKVSMETGSLTPLVKRMEASGLVTRRRDQQDERRVWVESTPQGWALRDQIVAVRQKVVQQLPIDAEQIASLRALLQDINAALESSSGSEERR